MRKEFQGAKVIDKNKDFKDPEQATAFYEKKKDAGTWL